MTTIGFPTLLNLISAESALFTDEACPFSFQTYPGGAGARVLVLTGDNASGKSLLFQVLAGWARREVKADPITVSIRERTGSGLSDISGLRRAMMFGDESEQSTGATSVDTVATAFRTAAAWAADGKTPLVMLDEPDMGLSEGFAGALGEHLAHLTGELPDLAFGVVIVTHSRALVRRLSEGLATLKLGAAHFTYMGEPAMDLAQWLAQQPEKSVEDLLALRELGSERRRAVAAILRDRRSAHKRAKSP